MQNKKEKKSEYDEFQMYSDKNCPEIKRPRKPKNVMQSVTKETDVQLPKPSRLCSDKKCQSTRCYKNMSPRTPKYD